MLKKPLTQLEIDAYKAVTERMTAKLAYKAECRRNWMRLIVQTLGLILSSQVIGTIVNYWLQIQ